MAILGEDGTVNPPKRRGIPVKESIPALRDELQQALTEWHVLGGEVVRHEIALQKIAVSRLAMARKIMSLMREIEEAVVKEQPGLVKQSEKGASHDLRK